MLVLRPPSLVGNFLISYMRDVTGAGGVPRKVGKEGEIVQNRRALQLSLGGETFAHVGLATGRFSNMYCLQ